jgi:predicted PurR-regulated permease PerM
MPASMSRTAPSGDLTRATIGVLVIGLLVVACLWILKPFLGAIVWAAMLAIATWPGLLKLEARLGGRRWLAIVIMTLTMLLLIVLPLVIAVSTIVDHMDELTTWITSAAHAAFPPPPEWLAKVPFVGAKLSVEWQRLAATSHDELATQAAPYLVRLGEWFVGQIGSFGLLLLQFLMTIVITVMLYASGEHAATGVRRFARRLAGDRGEQSVLLAGLAIRAVALGITGTALTQSVVAGIGLAVCGIPYAGVLTAIIFVLCMVQAGPTPVLVPAIVWLYWSGHPTWGTVLVVWSLVVVALDNVLRPFLIKRGADMPLPLIFAGAIGGLIGLGLIGLFVGPVVLAVTYRLLEGWISDIDTPPPADAESRERA